MVMLDIWPIPVFSDNYVWVLQRENDPGVTVVDPGDGVAVLAALEKRGLSPTAVLVTHHHADHIGGLDEIVERDELPVFGPATEQISEMNHPLSGGDRAPLPDLGIELEVIDVPGHTAGHVASGGPGFLLSGDTLFAGGCGRVFEGTPAQMYDSLRKLAAYPADTRVYCAHEYTLSNLAFALAVEPDNENLQRRITAASDLRDRGEPTVPSTLDEEHRTNPFLRCHVDTVATAAARQSGATPTSEVEVFAAVRAWKDGWRG
jgi:hydroxyacylglutathione hydrolase